MRALARVTLNRKFWQACAVAHERTLPPTMRSGVDMISHSFRAVQRPVAQERLGWPKRFKRASTKAVRLLGRFPHCTLQTAIRNGRSNSE